MKKGVNVVITDVKNRVLILKRSSGVEFSPNLWDLPGGKVENNESLQEAVRREAKEESGFKVESAGDYFFVYHYPNGKINIYAFRVKQIDGQIQLNEEHTKFKWVSKDKWENLEYTPSVTATLREYFKTPQMFKVRL